MCYRHIGGYRYQSYMRCVVDMWPIRAICCRHIREYGCYPDVWCVAGPWEDIDTDVTHAWNVWRTPDVTHTCDVFPAYRRLWIDLYVWRVAGMYEDTKENHACDMLPVCGSIQTSITRMMWCWRMTHMCDRLPVYMMILMLPTCVMYWRHVEGYRGKPHMECVAYMWTNTVVSHMCDMLSVHGRIHMLIFILIMHWTAGYT